MPGSRGPHGDGVLVGLEAGDRAGDADRGDRPVVGSEHRSGDADQPDRGLLVLVGDSVLDDTLELPEQRPGAVTVRGVRRVRPAAATTSASSSRGE